MLSLIILKTKPGRMVKSRRFKNWFRIIVFAFRWGNEMRSIQPEGQGWTESWQQWMWLITLSEWTAEESISFHTQWSWRVRQEQRISNERRPDSWQLTESFVAIRGEVQERRFTWKATKHCVNGKDIKVGWTFQWGTFLYSEPGISNILTVYLFDIVYRMTSIEVRRRLFNVTMIC